MQDAALEAFRRTLRGTIRNLEARPEYVFTKVPDCAEGVNATALNDQARAAGVLSAGAFIVEVATEHTNIATAPNKPGFVVQNGPPDQLLLFHGADGYVTKITTSTSWGYSDAGKTKLIEQAIEMLRSWLPAVASHALPPEPKTGEGDSQESIEIRAIACLYAHPDWAVKKIAKTIGTTPQYLSAKRHKKFRSARAALKSTASIPKGSKSLGRVEAYSDDE